jgi:hypothetical protein
MRRILFVDDEPALVVNLKGIHLCDCENHLIGEQRKHDCHGSLC